jgi:hypothetical protein
LWLEFRRVLFRSFLDYLPLSFSQYASTASIIWNILQINILCSFLFLKKYSWKNDYFLSCPIENKHMINSSIRWQLQNNLKFVFFHLEFVEGEWWSPDGTLRFISILPIPFEIHNCIKFSNRWISKHLFRRLNFYLLINFNSFNRNLCFSLIKNILLNFNILWFKENMPGFWSHFKAKNLGNNNFLEIFQTNIFSNAPEPLPFFFIKLVYKKCQILRNSQKSTLRKKIKKPEIFRD